MSEEKIAINKHIFKVSGCLKVSELAENRQIAEERLKRMWPRSTIEYLGEEFSHYVGDYTLHVAMSSMTKPDTEKKKGGRPRKSVAPRKSVEESMTDTIGTSFAGA